MLELDLLEYSLFNLMVLKENNLPQLDRYK